MSSLIPAAKAAAKALWEWYGADPFAANTGLFSWTNPDIAADIGGDNAAGINGAALLSAAGLTDTFQDMQCWWNDANAITAWVNFMLAADDRSYVPEVKETFTKAQLGWKPNYTNLTLSAAGGGIAGGWVGAATGLAVGGPAGAVIGGIIGVIAGAFGGGSAAAHSGIGRNYTTNFLNGQYDDEGWWALAWLRAYEVDPDARYISMAVTIFNDMASEWDNVLGGGIYWEKDHKGPAGKAPYKNAITNELFLAIATQLYIKLSTTPPDWVYFRGKDNKLWMVTGDGSQQTWLGNQFKTKSTPFVTADGWIYFQGTDNKLWKIDINGANSNWLGHISTASTPVVMNGWVYFQGTDNKLWKIDTNGNGMTWLGNQFKTKSPPFVTADGWIYFQGTDNKLWKIDIDGQNSSWLGSNSTSSTPFAATDGWVYFQGTDNKLWRIFNDGTQQSLINNNKTSSTPFISTVGPPAFDIYLSWAQKTWNWFSSPSTGMFSPSGLVMDSPDAPGAAEASDLIWSYNQGVILSGLCDLAQITGNPQLLERAEQIADTFISNRAVIGHQSGVTSSGTPPSDILTEMTDGAPDQPGYNGVANRQFKGIFIRNLAYLYKSASLPAYREFILNNAESMLKHDQNSANQFGSNWSGSFDSADFIRQSSALDLLSAGCLVE